ncbi:hypothetical protein [Streptomyces nojiriensis]|uniref:hypothetical protein n=1 Tax=Streptomyces nojiriensis TaxID=66374 RepID=UPI0035E15C43
MGATRAPAELPSWLARELERTRPLPAAPGSGQAPGPPRARQAVIAAGGGRGARERVLAGMPAEVVACASLPERAAFSEKSNRTAYTAAGLVAAGRVTEAEAEAEATRGLQEAAEQARPGQDRPGQDRCCRAIIRSGLSAGLSRPLFPGSRA